MRYFEFITDVCEWRAGRLPGGSPPREPRAAAVRDSRAQAGTKAWISSSTRSTPGSVSTSATNSDSSSPSRTAPTARTPTGSSCSARKTGADLFDACCRHYGNSAAASATDAHFFCSRCCSTALNPSDEFPRRLRVLRNLIEASESEFRPHRLPALVADVQRIVVDGSLDEINGFNSAQAERRAGQMGFPEATSRSWRPALFRLEDHPLLRGSLQAFELDADTFARRAAAFESLWPRRTAGATSPAPCSPPATTRGAATTAICSSAPRRIANRGGTCSPEHLARTCGEPPRLSARCSTLSLQGRHRASPCGKSGERSSARERRTENFDWRYYLVRYRRDAQGASGIYASVGGKWATSSACSTRPR